MQPKPFIWFLCLLASLYAASARSEKKDDSAVNKLQQMYRLYYLPFSIEFKQGKGFNDIFPMAMDKHGEYTQLLKPEELEKFDKQYTKLREAWKKKSLILNTPLEVGESNHLTQRLVSHRIPLNRTAWDKVSVSERIQINALLDGKPVEIKQAVAQVQFLQSFLKPLESEKFNFFVIGPSWCDSSREYRYLLESYAKMFPNPDYVLHSVVIEDPKEEIFDSPILKELFPHPGKYTHESVPRFLAFQNAGGSPHVWEEGEALKEFYERYLKEFQGFWNTKSDLFRAFPSPAVPSSSLLLASPTR